MIPVKELSAEEKALLIINSGFECLLQCLECGHGPLRATLAFKSTESGVWMYSLEKDSVNLIIDEFLVEVEDDAIASAYYAYNPKPDELGRLFKNREGFRIYGEKKYIGKFDQYTTLYAALEGPRYEPRNVELIKDLFDAYINCIREKLKKEKLDLLGRIDFAENHRPIARECVIGYLSKRIYGSSGDKRREDLYESLCMIASTPYEKAQNQGVIWCINKNVKNGTFIKFIKAIELCRDNVRQIRKLLEMSGEDNTLVLENGKIVGIYRRKGDNAGTGIRFTGNGKWRLFTSQSQYLLAFDSVTFRLTDQYQYNELEASIEEVFNGNADINRIKIIANTANKQTHGTTLIISDNAKGESERLAKFDRAVMIEPTDLKDEKAIISLTAIDGALMIDAYGCCYAIGTILDGVAKTQGRSSRGARYNSAATYVDNRLEKGEKVIAVIVSADDSIDVYKGRGHDDNTIMKNNVYLP